MCSRIQNTYIFYFFTEWEQNFKVPKNSSIKLEKADKIFKQYLFYDICRNKKPISFGFYYTL